MDKSVRTSHSYRNKREGESPSFSSTLLDAIYRSIDDGHNCEEELVIYRETMRRKYNTTRVKSTYTFEDNEKISNHQRVCMWMEKKSVPKNEDMMLYNSSSTSSDSSSGGLFSSSEGEFRPRQIQTKQLINKALSKQEEDYVKTKSRASKMYSDVKKLKQPISPGGKVASFLNSLFTQKKGKVSKSKSTSCDTSTCSSASSFSRSCLSKTPSSRGKSSNGVKRSVKFYPVSVIVDEDCQPCGHKSLNEEDKQVVARNTVNEELKIHIMEKTRRVEEAARDLLKNSYYDDDDDEDDGVSCASSDLFELDNLSPICIDRYHEELPVYETTHLDTNRAIAKGFIM